MWVYLHLSVYGIFFCYSCESKTGKHIFRIKVPQVFFPQIQNCVQVCDCQVGGIHLSRLSKPQKRSERLVHEWYPEKNYLVAQTIITLIHVLIAWQYI